MDLDDEFGIDAATDEEIDNDEFFIAKMGGDAIRQLLKDLDVSETIIEFTSKVNDPKTSSAKREEF